MATPSIPNTFSPSTRAKSTLVNANFTALLNAMIDGTADLSIGSLHVNGSSSFGNTTTSTHTFTGNCSFGNTSTAAHTLTGSVMLGAIAHTAQTHYICGTKVRHTVNNGTSGTFTQAFWDGASTNDGGGFKWSFGGDYRATLTFLINVAQSDSAPVSAGGISNGGAWTWGTGNTSTNDHTLYGNIFMPWSGGGSTRQFKFMGAAASNAYASMRFEDNGDWRHLIRFYWNNAQSDSAPGEYGRCGPDNVWRNTAGTWSTLSDERLKKEVKKLENALNKIMKLQPVTYEWKFGLGVENRPKTGFIAQEVEKVLPGIVVTCDQEYQVDGKQVKIEGVKEINYGSEIIAHLVKAIQELKAEFDAYKLAHS